MTSFGPCQYHCGSRVNVAVKVKVGRDVGDGEGVNVSVGENVGVWVTG